MYIKLMYLEKLITDVYWFISHTSSSDIPWLTCTFLTLSLSSCVAEDYLALDALRVCERTDESIYQM